VENYFLERTHKTPQLTANTAGEITIEGICIPENVQADFSPFMNWINEYLKSPAERTTLSVQLDYFNTSTAAILLNLFRTMSKIKAMGKAVVINWYFEDDDLEIKESGHDFASIVDVEFNVQPFTK
jgi:hypothetical protein